jgi:hypothetical protein
MTKTAVKLGDGIVALLSDWAKTNAKNSGVSRTAVVMNDATFPG